MPPLLRLFGTPSLERPHRLEFRPLKPVWLLLVLAYRGAWVAREELLGLFWPESDEDVARHSLRLWVSRAKALPWAEGWGSSRAPNLDRAQIRVVIAALRHGEPAQRARVAAVVPTLRPGAVPGYVWREFEAVRDVRLAAPVTADDGNGEPFLTEFHRCNGV